MNEPDPEIAARRKRIILKGDVPSPTDPPKGCRFHTRCPFAQDRCRSEAPVLRRMAEGHEAACHFAETLPPAGLDFSGGLSEAASKRLALYARARAA